MTENDPAVRRFLLLHGWQNRRPEGHWQRWLAEQLTSMGHRVIYPQLPGPDEPVLDRWLDELRRGVAGLGGSGGGGERVVVCHSLGCLLWLHAVDRFEPGELGVDRVLLVAPPSASFILRQSELLGFAPPVVEPARLADVRVAAGDDDPCCPEGAAQVFGLDTDVVPGGGHLAMGDGYGPWPGVLDWCLDGSKRLVGRADQNGQGPPGR
ncbi:putative alpha/beta hydrolase family esterase [Streptacidiphilus sp. MAP12-20]|uniref:RBBP9/YdeN family alpha/beta hydrolase n=1 Tax=Streptacidiphilus sp. MAP12-20 TaxID=3156299 RepID=UPI003514F08F